MAILKREHCVAIRVPLKNKKNGLGSGYSLGTDWVITAHHVLFPKNRDESQPITIFWWDETADQIKQKESIGQEQIVWSNGDHDLALIRCKAAPYVDLPSAWDLIDTKEPPRGGAICECAGFLGKLLNKKEDPRFVDGDGKLGIGSPKQNTTRITMRGVELEKGEYWGGFSGAPVAVNDRLVAIVQARNTGEKNSLTASFISPALDSKGGPNQVSLRDVPGFLERPEKDECWERLRSVIIRALAEDKDVFMALRDETGHKANAEDLAAYLYNMPEDDFIKMFSEVYGLIRQQGQIGPVRTMKDLACFWLALLASKECSLSGVDEFKKDPSRCPFIVRVQQPERLIIEGVAANSDGRNPDLRQKGEHLGSQFDLTPGNHLGFDESGHQVARHVQQTVLLKTQPGLEAFPEQDVLAELEAYASGPKGGGLRLPNDPQKRVRLIGKLLERGTYIYGGSYYIWLPHTEGLHEDPGLQQLRQWCPQLLIFAVIEEEKIERTVNLWTLNTIIQDALEFLGKKTNQEN